MSEKSNFNDLAKIAKEAVDSAKGDDGKFDKEDLSKIADSAKDVVDKAKQTELGKSITDEKGNIDLEKINDLKDQVVNAGKDDSKQK